MDSDDVAASIAFTAALGVLVVLALSMLASRMRGEPDEPAPHVTAGERPRPGAVPVHHMVPPSMLAFATPR